MRKNFFIRTISTNLAVGLLIPIALRIRWLPNIYDAFAKGIYKYYDFQISSLREFLFYVYGQSYFIDYLIGIVLILFPFQFIKYIYLKKKKQLNLISKMLILSGIIISIIISLGSFNNIWWIPWYKNLIYVAFAFGFGIIFTIILYFTVDIFSEKKKN